MQINLPLDKMTATEKIETMEAIWESLCSGENMVASPSWHGEVLAQRENENFIEWELSKKQIISKINEN